MGKKFGDFLAMPKWEYKDYLGWDEQGDGKLFYGIYVAVRGWACTALHPPPAAIVCSPPLGLAAACPRAYSKPPA